MSDHVKRAHDNAFRPFDPQDEEEADIEQETSPEIKRQRVHIKEETPTDQADQVPPPPEVAEEIKNQYDRVKVRLIKSPIKPSAKEVAEHMVTHTPYRSWCPTLCGRASEQERTLQEGRQ